MKQEFKTLVGLWLVRAIIVLTMIAVTYCCALWAFGG